MARKPARKTPRIGFIGLDRPIGQGIAARILAGGFPLTILAGRTPAAADPLLADGAEQVASPAIMAGRCSAIVLCVSGANAVREVIHGPGGILECPAPGLIIVDASSNEPGATRALATVLRENGMALADAPVFGSRRGPDAGELVSLVGATDETMEAIRPLLACYSDQVTHVGPVGSGLKARLRLLRMPSGALKGARGPHPMIEVRKRPENVQDMARAHREPAAAEHPARREYDLAVGSGSGR